jgi:hypothetical protein
MLNDNSEKIGALERSSDGGALRSTPVMGPSSSNQLHNEVTDGVKVLPPALAQSADIKYPTYIPTVTRIPNALLDQAHYCVTYANNSPMKLGNRLLYHLQTFVCYRHLEKS